MNYETRLEFLERKVDELSLAIIKLVEFSENQNDINKSVEKELYYVNNTN